MPLSPPLGPSVFSWKGSLCWQLYIEQRWMCHTFPGNAMSRLMLCLVLLSMRFPLTALKRTECGCHSRPFGCLVQKFLSSPKGLTFHGLCGAGECRTTSLRFGVFSGARLLGSLIWGNMVPPINLFCASLLFPRVDVGEDFRHS